MKKLSDNASLQFILTLILYLNSKRVIMQKKELRQGGREHEIS